MQNENRTERLADVVNEEPIVFMDCTGPEILGAFLFSTITSLIICIAFSIAIGLPMIGVIGGLIIGLIGTWFLLNILRDIRQKYYATWLDEKFYLLKEKHGLYSLPFFKSEKAQFIIKGSRRFGKGGRRGRS